MSYYDSINQFDKAFDWRSEADSFLIDINIKTFNPTINYEKNKYYDPKGVVNQNICYLKKADLLLVNLEYLEHSPGSLFEMFYAYLNHIPIVAFGQTNIYFQPHIRTSIDVCFTSLDKALEYIKDMYGQE